MVQLLFWNQEISDPYGSMKASDLNVCLSSKEAMEQVEGSGFASRQIKIIELGNLRSARNASRSFRIRLKRPAQKDSKLAIAPNL